MKKASEMSRFELQREVERLREHVAALEKKLDSEIEKCELLRTQNDYMHELLKPVSEHAIDSAVTVPVPSQGSVTRPSSPQAIHLDELAAALEASETARSEREAGFSDPECPLCGRTDEHEHEIFFNSDDDIDPSKLN